MRKSADFKNRRQKTYDQVFCLIFFTQILHSNGENFTKGRYHEKR